MGSELRRSKEIHRLVKDVDVHAMTPKWSAT